MPEDKAAIERFRQYCSDLSKTIAAPIFVKVGANDGVTADPCSDIFLADSRWKGLLVEPVPYLFDRLKKAFGYSSRFILEKIAIGAKTGKETFYYVQKEAAESLPNLPPWYDQLGSFDKNHILKHLEGVLEPFIVECLVEVCPLSHVLQRNGINYVTLLHVDCEGHDYEVLKTLDFEAVTPSIIYIEHMHLPPEQKQEMFDLLCSRDYSVQDCGNDYFAVHKTTRI
jgi:FkbM family methyltransferase